MRRTAPVATDLGWLGFFGRRLARRRAAYRQFMAEAFDRVIASPWAGLRAGLVLGGDALLEKVEAILKNEGGQEEVRWNQARSVEARPAALAMILGSEADERIRVWARVRLGRERPADIAREKGFRDGGSVLQIVKRTAARAATDHALHTRLKRLESAMSIVES